MKKLLFLCAVLLLCFVCVGMAETLDELPESKLLLIHPATERVEVLYQIYPIEFEVNPGSAVFINDEDYSDLFVPGNGGHISVNMAILPIGDNVFTIRVQEPGCRETVRQVVIYRAPQQIPLELAAYLPSRYTSFLPDEEGAGYMAAFTMPVDGAAPAWADITVLSPHIDLKVQEDGAFSFRAVFDRIGYNTIIIEATAPGCETSRVEHEVYYVPPVQLYTACAWVMDDERYSDFLEKPEIRIANTQIYQCVGEIVEILSDDPQMAVMKLDAGDGLMMVLRNYTYDTWIVGKRYMIFGDAYGIYNGSPWLNGRYSYIQN